jgi:hypothetical protein
MKKLIWVSGILLLFAFTSSYAQDGTAVISSKDAKDYIGKTVQVKGIVADIFNSKAGNMFINFDGKSPNQTFTVAVMKDAAVDVSKITIGCTLTISGEIKEYKGKPEIMLTSNEQIISIEEPK